MIEGPLGYGRYSDQPAYVGCPRARSDMTPCIARNGWLALADDGTCVGCYASPVKLLADLQVVVQETPAREITPKDAAEQLSALVRKVTEP